MKKTIHIKDQTHNPNFLTAHCMIAVRSNNLYRQRDMWGGGGKGGRGGEGRGGCSSQVFPQLTTSHPHSQKFEHLL